VSTPPGRPPWHDRLQYLVTDVGAQLLVYDADPQHNLIAHVPLARHWRIDGDDPDVLWLRPLAPSVRGADGTPVFNLSDCRRRGLHLHAARLDGDALVLDLVGGQRARIEPVDADNRAELDRWDTFTLARLTAEEEATLDALAEDSWHGRYA
jgi:hypothetical protein